MVAPNGSEELTFRHAFRITFLLSSSRIDGGDVDKVLIASNILYFLNFCKFSKCYIEKAAFFFLKNAASYYSGYLEDNFLPSLKREKMIISLSLDLVVSPTVTA
jgi:hypothetical protein